MAASALIIVAKVMMAGCTDKGWEPRTVISRVLDTAFAMFFLIRALMIFSGGTISPLVMFLAFAGVLREANGFREYRSKSFRHAERNVQAARQAFGSLTVRGKLPEGAVRP